MWFLLFNCYHGECRFSLCGQTNLFVTLEVGDNVGDCAARGADLFESIAAEIISAMILGGTMAKRCKIEGKFLSLVCRYLFSYWQSVG